MTKSIYQKNVMDYEEQLNFFYFEPRPVLSRNFIEKRSITTLNMVDHLITN